MDRLLARLALATSLSRLRGRVGEGACHSRPSPRVPSLRRFGQRGESPRRMCQRGASGFDSARLLFAKAQEKDRLAVLGRAFDFICKWNPRKQDKVEWVARAEETDAFVETRPGKRIAHLSLLIERAWEREKRTFRLIVKVTERTIDKKGQHLLTPQIELEGWWTTLATPIEDVIELYKHHGMHEQFHSEFKTDLDLERLPSGKFDTNDVILHLAAFTYNCLRLLGQIGLTGEIVDILGLFFKVFQRLFQLLFIVRQSRELFVFSGLGPLIHFFLLAYMDFFAFQQFPYSPRLPCQSPC